MERGEIDLALAFEIEMAAPQYGRARVDVLGGERERTGTDIARVLVVDHRGLAARVVEEAFRDAKLQHPLTGRRVGGGFRERVPGTKSHTPKVASCAWKIR